MSGPITLQDLAEKIELFTSVNTIQKAQLFAEF